MPRSEQIGLSSIVVAKDGKIPMKALVPSTRTFEEWCDNGLIEKAREVRDALLIHLRDLNGARRPDFFTSLGIQIPVISDGMRRVRVDVMRYLTSIDEILEQSARNFHEGLKLRIDDLSHATLQAKRELIQIQQRRPELEKKLKDRNVEIERTAATLFGPIREKLFEDRSKLRAAVYENVSREEFLKSLLRRMHKEIEQVQVKLREKKLED